jgi:phosphoribosylformylglycinamidine synthase
MLKFAVIQFPGSNCDQDCIAAINAMEGLCAEYVWHKETSLRGFDAIVLPGGFAYGDYLRCGAIARFSPVMQAVKEEARTGKLVLGTCNGFQILCEAGMLPGALVRNRSLRFVCDMVTTRVEVADCAFTRGCPEGSLLRLPVAHGEGCYFADQETLRQLNEQRQIILRYTNDRGDIDPNANPNGSIENIAGICNREGNVFGLMPHPDRAADERLGSADGAKIFRSMTETIVAGQARAAYTPRRVSLFVTGTDTGVGKTHTVIQLLRLLRAEGVNCAGMKPICCGDRRDAEVLLAASSEELSIDEINPVWLKTPLAPLAAAQIEQATIDTNLILVALDRLRRRVDQVVVEGVGGWLVPIRPDYFISNLAVDMKLPVLVIAQNRLGCLNHAALTVRSVADYGLRCVGVVMNNSLQKNDIAIQTNPEILRQMLTVPVLPELASNMVNLPAEWVEILGVGKWGKMSPG